MPDVTRPKSGSAAVADSAPRSQGGPPALALSGARIRSDGRIRPRLADRLRARVTLVAIGVLSVAVVALVLSVVDRRVVVPDAGTLARGTVLARVELAPTEAAPSAAGQAVVLKQAGHMVLLVHARGVPPNRGDRYAVWIVGNGATDLLGLVSQSVGDSRSFSSLTALPEDVSYFQQLLITRETGQEPTEPGLRVLAAPLTVP